jgi:hypothetical protein
MILSLICFILAIIIFIFRIIIMNRDYLCEISSKNLIISRMQKEIDSLNNEVSYYKNQKKYEEYLKD